MKDVHSVPHGIIAAEKGSGFSDFIRAYFWILIWIMVALGLFLVVSLQFKWAGIAWFPEQQSEADASAIRFQGPKTVFSKETFAVDTSETYRLSADVRVLSKSDGSPQVSKIYLGVQTFDARGHELRSGPGTYRYAGALNKTLGSEQDWVHIEGLITGEGDENHHQFRPGTRSVKLVLLPNYKSGSDTTLMVRNVEFSQLVTFSP